MYKWRTFSCKRELVADTRPRENTPCWTTSSSSNLPSEQQTRNSSSVVQDPFCGDGPCLHVILVLRGAAASPAVIKGFFASCTVNQSVMANVCHGTSAETPESVHHHEVTRIVRHVSFHKNALSITLCRTGVFCLYFLCAPKMQRGCNGEPSQGPPVLRRIVTLWLPH